LAQASDQNSETGGIPDPGAVRSEVSGTARDVVQARDIHGSLNFVHAGENTLPVPMQLPRDVRWLVGRQMQLRWLDRMVTGDGEWGTASRTSVISGMAGTGKTSLAVHWAHRVRSHFPGGQLYADLCGYSPEHPEFATRVLDRFLRSLNIPDTRVPTDLQEKEGLYRSLLAERRVLVVLDNAASTAQVRPLLPGSDDSAVVVTSRSRLAGIDAASYLTLDPLSCEDAVELLRSTLRDSRSDADEDLGALAVACAQLPLALRIAAQRAAHRPMTPLADLLEALRDSSARWTALSMQNGNEAEAVHSVFAWSYYALPPTTSRFFRLLGLHPRPEVCIEAAAALAGVTRAQARTQLEVLTDAHLVEQPGPRRYRLHDLIAAYARDRAEAQESVEDREAARRRVLVWYLRASYAASVHADLSCHYPLEIEIEAPADPEGIPAFPCRVEAAAWFEQEWPNLVAAVDMASEHGYLDLVWKLAATLRLSYHRADRREAGLALQYGALAATKTLGDLVAEGTILEGLSFAHFEFEQAEEFRAMNCAAIAIWSRLGERRRQGISRTTATLETMYSRDWPRAISAIKQIIATAEELDQPRLLAVNLGNLGECMLEVGRFDEACDLVSRALELNRGFEWYTGVADNLWNLSRIMRACNRSAEAVPFAEEAVEQSNNTTYFNLQNRVLLELAKALHANSLHVESLSVCQQALARARHAGDRLVEARALARLALIHRDQGDLDLACELQNRSIEVSRTISDEWRLARSLEQCAETLDRLQRPGDAAACRTEALILFTKYDEPAAHAACKRLTAALG
jgi:tetratricopeptide (TPR) repeat protein